MLEKEFAPYQESLELKELGFDEECIAVRHRDNTLFSIVTAFTRDRQSEGFGTITNSECLWEDDEESINGIQEVTSPTYSQAFRFFREKYGLHQYIQQYCGERFYFYIEDMIHPRRYEEYLIENLRNFGEYTSHEEAELACLKKLIEIVKSKQ